MGKRILAIDDELPILEAMKNILEDMGHSVTIHTDSIKGEEAALQDDFDLILIDIQMPEKDGTEITKNILRVKKDAVILIITAFPGDNKARMALDAGAKTLVKKPFEIGKILSFL